jgi:hypothetical protein
VFKSFVSRTILPAAVIAVLAARQLRRAREHIRTERVAVDE